MDNLLKNKKTIIVCLSLLILVSIIIYFNNKSKVSEYVREYEEIIQSYDANQFIPIYVTESDMANKYLNDFKNLMMNDINLSYEMLNSDYKNKKFGSLEKYREYIMDQYSESFYSMSVKEYDVVNNNNYKFYYIRDSRDKLYIFKELSIMNYEVFLDNYTVEIK